LTAESSTDSKSPTHLATRSIAIAATAALLMVLGYFRWRSNQATFDDAFISFRYARNLVEGNGLVFNPGEHVEGYTNFLWTLLAALGIGLGWDPLATTRTVGVAAYLAVILLGVMAVGSKLQRGRELGVLALLAMLVLPPSYASFAGTGLETSFVGLMMVLTGMAQLLWDRGPGWGRTLAGVPPLLAVLTRLDAGIAVLASALVIAMAERDSWKTMRARLLPALGPTFVGLGVQVAWRLHYYGDLLPNTYYAKAAYLFSFGPGVTYLFGFARSCPSSLLLLGFTVFAAVAAKDVGTRAFARYAGMAFLAQAAFLAKVGGDFMEYRLLWEYWPLLVAGGALGLLALLRENLVLAVLGAAGTLALARTPVVMEMEHQMQSVSEMDEIASRTQRVGRVLDAVLPPGTVIATTAAGMAYHVPHLEVIDQWGLNDGVLAHLPVDSIRVRGHVKFAPSAYLVARNVNLVFGHPSLTKCSNPRRQNRAQVFIRIGEGDACVRSAYLTPTLSLTQHFCMHPHQFLLNRVDCSQVTRVPARLADLPSP